MIEIRIPEEITKYKEKMFFGLTLRQTICVVVASGINIPLYLYGKKYIGSELASWVVMINAVPLLLAGFFKYNGMNFEKLVAVVIAHSFIYPQKRKVQVENLYEIITSQKEERGGKKNAQNTIRT